MSRRTPASRRSVSTKSSGKKVISGLSDPTFVTSRKAPRDTAWPDIARVAKSGLKGGSNADLPPESTGR